MTSTMIRRGPASAETRDESPGQERHRRRRAAKFDLRFHYAWTRTFFGFGRRVCMCCGKRWGRDGCAARAAAIQDFKELATTAELRQAAREHLLTEAEAGLPPGAAYAYRDLPAAMGVRPL
ncbi:hypothetical protein [Glycomyces salinus]|uniref:hypothetical protein n=1 Tax=Glycomyces salinus TaxID=980294 RepID=UPI0018EB2998|nr:hypothetical protein [Glycomyces salinus]